MKKKISISLFFTVMWRGICQFFQFIAKIFGYKDESTYAKVIWRLFAGCITCLLCLFTGCVLYVFGEEVVVGKWIKSYKHHNEVYQTTHLSNDIVFQDMYSSNTGRIYDEARDKVLVTGVDWVVNSDNKDSLAVFSKDNKRGFINRFTGNIDIPLQYTKAWVFSEGLAAVEKDNKLVFIDHKGNVVIDKNLDVHSNAGDYLFKNGYCMVTDSSYDKNGLLDKKGNWAVEPIYDNIYNDCGFWKFEKDGLVGLYSKDLELMFPAENKCITINDADSIIEVRSADHIARRYDFKGNMVVDFVIDEVSNMEYEKNELRNDVPASVDETEYDNKVYGIANCKKYKVYSDLYLDYYGLLDKNGKRITDPIYTSIEAIAANLYLCQPQGIIINDQGQIVE